MKRLKQRVFSLAEFEKGDRLEKIYIHVMEPGRFPLNARDEEHLERLRQVWAIMVDNSTQRARVRLISEAVGINERNVRDFINDAQYLFGDLLTVDSEFEKAIIAERLWTQYDKANDAEDYEVASKIMERIAKLKGYDREDGGIRREDLNLPEVEFTSNPNALTERIEGEYIDHEDIELLEPQAGTNLTG